MTISATIWFTKTEEKLTVSFILDGISYEVVLKRDRVLEEETETKLLLNQGLRQMTYMIEDKLMKEAYS